MSYLNSNGAGQAPAPCTAHAGKKVTSLPEEIWPTCKSLLRHYLDGSTNTLRPIAEWHAQAARRDDPRADAIRHWLYVKFEHAAIRHDIELLDALTNHGLADIAVDRQWHRTPLHAAAHHGFLAGVILLVGEGADVDAKAYCDTTPLDLALEEGHLNVALMLYGLRCAA